ncbi:DNA cytosine methyltransferase [Haloferax sulfurifontis]|uniref:DNA cytosine methyltransferase n=1 Tax=Haloferax sulfurifontis TaxID=255616 RepID=UPI00373AEE63
MFGLPESYRRALVEGYQQADGSVDSHGRVSATSVSKQLALGIKHVLESLGVAASLPSPQEKENENHQTTYTVGWDWTLSVEENNSTFAEDGQRWTRVVKTEPAKESTTVYDLTVEDDHSFVVDGVVAHNSSWGPVDDEGSPSRNGDIFEAWVNTLHALGYSVDWRVLNAADYGDATSRRRLFVVGRKGKRAEFPEPTHSEAGVDGTDEWRPASEVIDWSDRGESIWERSRPLVNNTMQRIAEGIRRHCDDDLAPFADVIDDLGKPEVNAMQADIVDADDVPEVAEQRCEPFLVKYYGTSTAKSVDEPMDTITANGGKYALCTPYVLGQHGGSVARDVDERPLPTIATRGAIGLYQPEAFVLPRNMVHGGLHSNGTYTPDERPLHTVTANNHDGHVVTPYLIEYYGNGRAQSLDDPLPTVTTKARFALVVPELYPLGLDIRFRMLQPRELAAAMGFPEEYELVGNKTQVTKQIGNAVPVNLAKNLVNQLLTGDAPSLHTFANEQGVEADD